MKTNVTFRHLKSEPELYDSAIELANSFEKFHEDIMSTDVIFTNDAQKSVEFTVRVQGSTLVGKDSSEDFHKSLSEASDKIVRQLRKWKTKRFGI
jgi:ribosomal subunit interface protein